DSAPLPAVWRTDDAAFSATWIRWVRALAPTGSRPLMPIERWTLAPASGRSFRAEPVVWTHMHVPERSRHDLRALREDRDQCMFIGCVLVAARVGMWHPDGRQPEHLGKDIIRDRSPEVRLDGRVEARRLADRVHRCHDDPCSRVQTRGRHAVFELDRDPVDPLFFEEAPDPVL